MADHALRKPFALGQERPVIRRDRLDRDHPLPGLGGRYHVQDREFPRPLGVIQRESICDPPAPIMADDHRLFLG